MNYLNIYNQIVNRSLSEDRKKIKSGEYFENHHIIPTCLGGSNIKENKVLLTAREHFICHKLLVEIYPEERSLVFSLHRMCHSKSKNHKRDYKISSREFERLRILCSRFNPMKGRNHTEDSKQKISIHKTGKKSSEDTKDKIRIVRTGSEHPKEVKEKIRSSSKNRKKVKCPFCNKIMDISNAKKYHFDNCELSPLFKEENRIKYSEESKIKVSNSLRNLSELICPYCGLKSKSRSNMKRYHFENCKLNLK